MENTENGGKAGAIQAPKPSVRKEIVLLLDEIANARDPGRFREEQLPRLRELVAKHKSLMEG